MVANASPPGRVSFGDFDLDPRALELRKRGRKVKVQGQPLEILAILLERPRELVTREELQQRLWPADTFVDFEQSLNAAIKRLRVALDDSAEQPQFIETLARRGYRFIGRASRAEVAAGTKTEQPTIRRRRLLLAVAVGLLVAAVTYAGWRWQQGVATAKAKRVMLAVLPFENLGGDPEQEYFSDGLTEEMITQLGTLHPERLGVIARTSAMRYKGDRDIPRIIREVGADYVLEGSVRREGARVRISVRLVQARDQTQLWAQSYERDLRGILVLQQDLAGAVGREIQLKLTLNQQARLAASRPVNPEAHEAYLKGLFFWNKFTVESFLKSQEFFQQAIEKDPRYAPAYAGLAAVYALQGNFGVLPPDEAYPRSKAAAAKAIERDETVSFAHSQLGFVTMYYDRDWAGAEREFKRAIELNPSNANAHQGYAFYFALQGRFEEALAEIRRARELDPLSLIINSDVGFILYFARRHDEALAQLQKTREMDTNFPPTYWVQSIVYQAKGMHREAIATDLKAAALAHRSQENPEWMAEVRRAYDASGWIGAQRRSLVMMLKEREQTGRLPAFWIAETYANLGDKEKAIDWLAKAVEERFYLVVFLKVDPRFDSLRDHPRFQALLQRLGL